MSRIGWRWVVLLVASSPLACGSAGGTDVSGANDAAAGAPAKKGSGAGGRAGTGGTSAAGAPSGGGSSGANAGSGASTGGGATAGTTGAGGACDGAADDLAGCNCTASTTSATRACWPASVDPAARGVGACKDGVQACQGSGEVHTYGPCVGATLPAQEACTNGVDDDCNGLVDCKDPSCAQDAACAGACNDGDTRPCYDGPAGTAGVGVCAKGMQTCTGGAWPTTCPGEVVPSAENCTSPADESCDGHAGCDDPTCMASPACAVACTDGQTRPCYDGPPGTANVGTCKPGMQTCSGGQWPTTCPGEVLPTNEVCLDTMDHNCNGFRGCDDLFSCVTDPGCWGECTQPDPGCVCPKGTSDAAQCPDGYFGTTNGGGPGTGMPSHVECCPCSASTCNYRGCCGEPACAGSSVCDGLTCSTPPSSCGGMVDFDCDFEDYPTPDGNPSEDCDQICCKCRPPCQ